MNDIIQLLPDSVANQIAAGEVIQRPANVIKELVENAVDAGATTINVLIVDAGRTLIQVIDDGKGMSDTDARMSFERHATSKIRKAEDLYELHTMGFRGEALPSIAAVAEVELRTRTAHDDIGTQLNISGSRIVAQEPCACPVGCNFQIKNLFFNVPARRKFLASDITERKNALATFDKIALVYPEISFTFHANGVMERNLKKGNLRQRIVDIFTKKINEDLIPIDADTTLCKIYGFVGKPESARKKCHNQFFFVNGRYMRHPLFAKFVQIAYERLVPTGEQVPYFIYLEVPAADIDVNISPTKTEIKFEHEDSIKQILLAAVKEAIGLFGGASTIDFDTVGKPDIPMFDVEPDDDVQVTTERPLQYNPFRQEQHNKFVPKEWSELYKPIEQKPQQQDIPDFFGPAENDIDNPVSMLTDKSPAHFQYKGQYIVTSVKSGLMIVDQHRAHVRVLYERYLTQIRNRKTASQRLMFPQSVQFGVRDATLLDTVIDEMNAMGFELSPLGAGSYVINSLPAGLEGLDAERLVVEMVEETIEKGTTIVDEINESLALSMARKAATPIGQVMNNTEMERLITDLFTCGNINYTPDGLRIYNILEQADIDKMFGL